MKNISLKLILLIACIFVLNSFVSAINVYPSFKYEYKDNPPPPGINYNYTIAYAIQNSNGTNGSPWGPWYVSIGTFTTGNYPGTVWPFTDVSRSINYPTPPNAKCFRIVVIVQRDDGSTMENKFGYSDWTDESGLQSGNLEIHVDHF
ncbi:MAG TPA: hypothetical protein VFE71_01900 [Bacteroidales bacterium]|nr:hypothetical protein [Bacteroidales bacterium]